MAWDVVDEEGRWLRIVMSPIMPTHVAPSVRGNRLAMVTLVNEVPTVIVFDVVRAMGAT
jgi:hypothetical protein